MISSPQCTHTCSGIGLQPYINAAPLYGMVMFCTLRTIILSAGVGITVTPKAMQVCVCVWQRRGCGEAR